jgi:hypothetical protein
VHFSPNLCMVIFLETYAYNLCAKIAAFWVEMSKFSPFWPNYFQITYFLTDPPKIGR